MYTTMQEVGITLIHQCSTITLVCSLKHFHKNILQFKEAKGSGNI